MLILLALFWLIFHTHADMTTKAILDVAKQFWTPIFDIVMSLFFFFCLVCRTFLQSYNPQLSKNHQLHPINQVAYKFYVDV